MLAGAPMGWAPGLPWGHGCHRGAQCQPRAVPVPQTPEQEHNGTELCRAIIIIIIAGLRNNWEALRLGKYVGNKGMIEKK